MTEEMEKDEYARLAWRESFYFWNIGRREIIKDLLNRHLRHKNLEILDVGCGSGGNKAILGKFGRVTGLDISEDALRLAKKYGFAHLVKADINALSDQCGPFDLISSLDVFEHIENDTGAIKKIFSLLKKGGFLVVTVPAHPWLWSRHDEAMRHQRRYCRNEILTKLKNAGFEILEHSHFVTLAVPVNLLRKIRDKVLPKAGVGKTLRTYDVVFPSSLNTLLIFILRAEKFLMRFFFFAFWQFSFGCGPKALG